MREGRCAGSREEAKRIGRVMAPAARATLTYKGRTEIAEVAGDDLSSLFEAAARIFALPSSEYSTTLILKGKSLQRTDSALALLESTAGSAPPKVMVMASAKEAVAGLGSSLPDRRTPSFAAEHGSKKAGIPVSRGVRQASMKKR